MKKKIIIVSHNLRLGGVERSLIGLLHAIDYTRFEVDLFLFLHDGPLMEHIPKEVRVLPENKKYAGLISSVKDNVTSFNLDILLGKRKAKAAAQAYIQQHAIGQANLVYDNYLQQYNVKNLPVISEETYDLAISFLTPHYVASSKVKARKRIAWIHTDYSFFEFDKKVESEMWSAYDYIASISEDCTRGFVTQFPELESKIVLIENILDASFVRRQASAFSVTQEMPKEAGTYTLLSVGRFSKAKNFDNVPAITKHLLESGVRVKWYLIGFGGDEALIRQQIEAEGMEEHVIILGKKDNPYPYMAACDFYIQPSRFEGKAVTVREAQMLAKPVVITAFATSKSQLRDGVDGVIVPMEHVACVEGIKTLLLDTEKTRELIENCKQHDYGNLDEVQQVYALLEG